MSSQPSQRRYWRWFCLLMVLAMLVAVPLVVAAHHYGGVQDLVEK